MCDLVFKMYIGINGIIKTKINVKYKLKGMEKIVYSS